MRFKNIVIFEPFDKCDSCGNIPETLHKNNGQTLCEYCAKKQIKDLEKELDILFKKEDAGEVTETEVAKRQREIELEIIDLEFEY